MATTFGITDIGLTVEEFADVRADLEAALRAVFATSLALGNRSKFGQIGAILAERFADVWSVIQQVYSSQDPDDAAGASLDAICALTGTVRPPASSSAVILTAVGAPLTLVPAGTSARTVSTGRLFATRADASIVALSAWVSSTTYTFADRVVNGGNAYQCSQSGVSAGSGGPSGTGTAITDNTAKWDYLGAGTGAIDVSAACTVTGPIAANARDISNSIFTPVSGLNNLINVNDATPGRDVATDAELRVLRVLELSASGKSTADAIRAALLEVAGVTAVTVFVNNTDATDGNGVPPHAIEAMVQQEDPLFGQDQAIRDSLFANVSAGIVTHGGITGTSVDSQGVTHEIDFSRPTLVPIYVLITVIKDPLKYPSDGDAQIKAAIVAYGALQVTGKDAVSFAIGAQAFTVPGVLDVTACLIGTAPSPSTSTTVAISTRQLATYDSSRIGVTSSSGTP